MSKSLNRHEFLANLGRKGLLAGLAGLSLAALKGTKSPSECFNHNYCESCFAFTGCGLPEKKEIQG